MREGFGESMESVLHPTGIPEQAKPLSSRRGSNHFNPNDNDFAAASYF